MESCAALVALAEGQLPTMGWNDFDAWWLAAGTGTTLAGLMHGEAGRRPVHGALAVPPGHGAEANVQALVGSQGVHWHDASRGGFGKADAALMAFIDCCETQSQLPLEPLYTGKALLALHDHLLTGQVKPGSRLIFVHTGGLQGRRGFVTDLR
jgi:1-aminocyclopropane-1-carboxylate deaminase